MPCYIKSLALNKNMHQRTLKNGSLLNYSVNGIKNPKKAYIELLIECFIHLFGWYDNSTKGLIYKGIGKIPPRKYRSLRRATISKHVLKHQDRLLHFIGTRPIRSGTWQAYVSAL